MNDKILDYDKIDDKIKKLNELLNENKINEAFEKATATLEFINACIIMRKFKITIEDTNFIQITDIYSKTDKILFEYMLKINYLYENLTTSDITKNDVIFVLNITNDVIQYVKENLE